ncbi:MAG: alpha/beta fold hydrolase, partial [Marinicellaceae bacterium]
MNKTHIKIKCQDGFELAAVLYQPSSIKAAVMIAPATGIKKGFYHSFASYLCEKGFGVICFENRGIGESIKGNFNQVDASLIHWGTLDMSAVLEKLKEIFPHQSYHLIGHSAGGQLVGLMDNALELKSMFTFASSSGSLRNMPYPFKIFATFYLNIFIPISNLFFAKTNSQWIGMGEPLPKLVAKQWRRWCNGKGYVATDFGKDINHH